ncbi:hypothetical protein [Brevibacillus laterosporus]|uniref:hypothetical protein n=1 Tax=Brevibacillus laterosporus TaxID=1465 RepID=UPI000839BA4C|nr:hypothetical protein [Brevibacillus laterosporus]
MLNSDEAQKIAAEALERRSQTLGGYKWAVAESDVAELPQLKTRDILGKKACVSGRNIQNLIEVKRKRPYKKPPVIGGAISRETGLKTYVIGVQSLR